MGDWFAEDPVRPYEQLRTPTFSDHPMICTPTGRDHWEKLAIARFAGADRRRVVICGVVTSSFLVPTYLMPINNHADQAVKPSTIVRPPANGLPPMQEVRTTPACSAVQLEWRPLKRRRLGAGYGRRESRETVGCLAGAER